MSAGRPGGLTALAVMNFVFGGWGFLSLVGLAGFLLMGREMDPEATSRQGDPGLTAFQKIELPILIAFFSMACLASLFEIASGFGYLRQKRFLGRIVGNAFALLAIAAHVLFVVASREIYLQTIISILYPLLTLLLINTTFREDLVN
jgi:hypothetical protein